MTDTQDIIEEPFTFEALLSEEEIARGEETTKDMQLGRRIALHVLKFDSTQLREMVADDDGAEAMMSALEIISGYIGWRNRETELVNAAAGRLEIVLGEIVETAE